MKKLLFLSLFTLAFSTVFADDEYASKDVNAPNELHSVDAGAPLIATKKYSYANILYIHEFTQLMRGDLITQLSFKGFNPGEPFIRNFIVWMANTERRDIRTEGNFVENKIKVFEGKCTIAAGGNADECITLLTIPLEQPFEYDGSTMRVIIESTGEPVEQDVCFERSKWPWHCYYTIGDEDGEEGDYAYTPVVSLTVLTPVVNLTGTVRNQDNKPVPNATIEMRSSGSYNKVVYVGETDNEGYYSMRIEEGNKSYSATVSAPGYATYTEQYRAPHWKDKPQFDFTLYDAVEYKAGRRATIIMPVTPDASAGKYYRLDRREDNKLIFEREPSPQANVPYVIVPDRDFAIDLKPLDLTMIAGKTQVWGVDFIGSYTNIDFGILGAESFKFLDETPDVEDYGRYEGGRVAALRAYLFASAYVPEIVFNDDTDGISPTATETIGKTAIFDLQGRRLSGKPAKGVYIENGRKRVVK